MDACRAIGAEVRLEGDTIEIAGVIGKPKVPDNVIDAKNSGTTMRLCMSMAALADGATVFTGDDSLRRRPNGPLIKALNDLGAVCYSTRGTGTAPIVVHGVIEGGKVTLKGNVSSQFISSLLISLPFAQENTRVDIEGELKSRPYVEVTLEMLEAAGWKGGRTTRSTPSRPTRTTTSRPTGCRATSPRPHTRWPLPPSRSPR